MDYRALVRDLSKKTDGEVVEERFSSDTLAMQSRFSDNRSHR